ncbi:indolethylamine N-methyltransferase-like [Ambystoma mexicanum]|uniref:indolethylamine N-methyltransferase-like n=1 Tax=Ambystoma mexicanum TaxID=8296 RepID=UPI0037E8BE9B
MASPLTLEELYDKHYHPRDHYATYFSKESSFADESLALPIRELYNVFKSGSVNGDILIKIGHSFMAHLLVPACGFFKEIIVADHMESSNEELRKWLKNDPDAMDYDEALKHMCELEGDRERWSEKKEVLRRTVQKVVKCDIMKSNPLFPLCVPQADCLITTAYLEAHCLDMKSFCTALCNISSLLKIGGHLVMYTMLGCTFVLLGTFKFPYLCLDKGGLTEAVSDAGYAIETLEVFPRTTQCEFDIVDYTHLVILVACKQRNV